MFSKSTPSHAPDPKLHNTSRVVSEQKSENPSDFEKVTELVSAIKFAAKMQAGPGIYAHFETALREGIYDARVLNTAIEFLGYCMLPDVAHQVFTEALSNSSFSKVINGYTYINLAIALSTNNRQSEAEKIIKNIPSHLVEETKLIHVGLLKKASVMRATAPCFRATMYAEFWDKVVLNNESRLRVPRRQLPQTVPSTALPARPAATSLGAEPVRSLNTASLSGYLNRMAEAGVNKDFHEAIKVYEDAISKTMIHASLSNQLLRILVTSRDTALIDATYRRLIHQTPGAADASTEKLYREVHAKIRRLNSLEKPSISHAPLPQFFQDSPASEVPKTLAVAGLAAVPKAPQAGR